MKPIKKVDYSELDLKAIELYAELLQNFTDIAKKVEKFRSKHIANYPLLFTIQQDSEYFVSEMKK
jgi:3-dehydroquinate dehydratase